MPGGVELEARLEARVIKYLREKGCLVLKLNVKNHRGWPDLLVVPPGGAVYFIELKRERGGRFSKLQEYAIRKLQEFGVRVDIVRGMDDLRA